MMIELAKNLFNEALYKLSVPRIVSGDRYVQRIPEHTYSNTITCPSYDSQPIIYEEAWNKVPFYKQDVYNSTVIDRFAITNCDYDTNRLIAEQMKQELLLVASDFENRCYIDFIQDHCNKITHQHKILFISTKPVMTMSNDCIVGVRIAIKYSFAFAIVPIDLYIKSIERTANIDVDNNMRNIANILSADEMNLWEAIDNLEGKEKC
jgi:hypothetical protein